MATPALRIRIAPKFPTKIQGSGGISVTRTGGVVTIGGASLRPYPSVTAASASKIDLATEAVRVDGWGMPGDGGAALYKRVNLEPSHAGKFQDANGAWFELSVPAVSPEMIGGDVQDSMLVASALGARWVAAPKTYTVSTLAVPDWLNIEAAGATIDRVGTLAARASFITIGKNVTADELNFTFDGTELGNSNTARLVDIGDDFTCGTLSLSADAALGYAASLNGAWATGVRTRIGSVRATNIDYPLALINPSTSVLATGSNIGGIVCEGYLRPLYLQYFSGKVGDIKAKGRSASAGLISAPYRYISVLLEGVESTQIGNLHLEECGHGVRIGGSPHANARSQNITFGNIFVTKTRGCAFKIDPTLLVSPGVTEVARVIRTGSITGVDVGDGTSEGNREGVRLTRVVDVETGPVALHTQDASFSGQAGVALNAATDVRIAALHCDNSATVHVWLNADNDSDGALWFGGPVKNVRIGPVSGKAAGSTMMVVQSASHYTMEWGGIDIDLNGATFGTGSSANTRLFNVAGTTPVFDNTLRTVISGHVKTAFAPVLLNLPSNATSSSFTLDVAWGDRRIFGTTNNPRFFGGIIVQSGGLDLGATPADGAFGALVAGARDAVAGVNAYGGALISARPGSNAANRGAGFASVQDAAGAASMGAAILTTGTVTVNSDQLTEHTRFHANGDLRVQTNGASLRLKDAGGSDFIISTATPLRIATFTVGTLPTAGVAGRQAHTSNGRALISGGTIEGPGAGTGCAVTDNGSVWKVTGTNITVSS